jgi:hypothetical protein
MWVNKAVILVIGAAIFIPSPIRAEEEFVFIVRDGDTARILTERNLVRPTAWERVVQYNYILKPGNVIRVPTELVRKEGAAFITDLYGTVQVKSSADPVWIPAPTGLILRAGDSVKTGLDSGVVLALGEGGEAILRGETTVVYQPYSKLLSGPVNRLSVLQGFVEARIPPADNREVNYEIETPGSILKLKGTKLRIKVSKDSLTQFEVLEGDIYVNSSGRKCLVGSDAGIIIGD